MISSESWRGAGDVIYAEGGEGQFSHTLSALPRRSLCGTEGG